MDFAWTEEQLALRESIRGFAETLNEDLVARERAGAFPHDLWRRAADFGLLSMSIPPAYNSTGNEVDIMDGVVAMEALGYGCRDNGLNLAIAAQMWTVQYPINEFGSEEQKAKYLPAMCRGELIGAHAVTEPEAGSDHMALQTHARRVADGYLLTGHKRYITLGPVADVALVFATVDPDKGRWGLTAFLVDTASEGCEVGPVRDKMGLRTVPMGDLIFTDCFVPEENRLGPEGAGASISGSSLGVERCLILATQVGAMERQLEQAVAYAKSRKQFGQPVGKFQSVSNRIADMRLALETARLLLYKVAWMIREEEPMTMEAALLKLHLSETFVQSSLDAVRTFGGAGYLTEIEIERDLRDSVGGLLYAGTNDIQRLVVARMLGL
ncbi:MAG: acyl-CoA dehydrogenase family protein [Acidimicrobiia bacterium]|nr:acyl-CoA dehydrogenase family protein [Acidimicrobiia bacterium]